ncbi:MAG: hypothetical protein H7039_17935 [Bryobacteraceae bacterium]|nr:hypothetical protein [Bryobacteraceae bacterium]
MSEQLTTILCSAVVIAVMIVRINSLLVQTKAGFDTLDRRFDELRELGRAELRRFEERNAR